MSSVDEARRVLNEALHAGRFTWPDGVTVLRFEVEEHVLYDLPSLEVLCVTDDATPDEAVRFKNTREVEREIYACLYDADIDNAAGVRYLSEDEFRNRFVSVYGEFDDE